MWQKGLLWCVVVCAGCGMGFNPPPPPDIRDVEVGLGAAMAIGQASSIAMNSVSSASPAACVTVAQPCSTYPCSGSVTVNLGAGCPLPLGDSASGTVTVSGNWSSADQATVQTTFTDASSGSKNVVVTSATSLTVKRNGTKVSVTYVGQNVNTKGATTLAAQSSWSIDVDTRGTANDPKDDRYTITGTQQSAGGSNTTQMTVENAVLDPGCRSNPVSGSATLQKVTSTTVQQSFVKFHAACDGKADVGTQSVTLNVFE